MTSLRVVDERFAIFARFQALVGEKARQQMGARASSSSSAVASPYTLSTSASSHGVLKTSPVLTSSSSYSSANYQVETRLRKKNCVDKL